MGVRVNIATNPGARDAYVNGVLALKAESAGVTTTALGIPPAPGFAPQNLSTWDLFVIWHVRSMGLATPAGSTRNAAHRGPAFLPWHRWMMILLEAQFQRVLGDPNFGLPYWDWAADGDLPLAAQPNQPVWAANCMGGSGRPVTTGPFAAGGPFVIRVDTNSTGLLAAVSRPLDRDLGLGAAGLPTTAQANAVLALTAYDASPWSASSSGFRNRVEGWLPSITAPNMHNRVHVWVGGDMGPSSSPNDPVFYLNHCNVDRLWSIWLATPPAKTYVPPPTAATSLRPHRRNDTIHSILTSTAPTNAQMLDVSQFYTYA
jgi:tyrosinase